jgi:hypothetical protein
VTPSEQSPAHTRVAGRPLAPRFGVRRLDRKLERIRAGQYTPDDFVLADAKDGDMGFGLAAPGPLPGTPERAHTAVGPGYFRSRDAYVEAMRTLVGHDVLDIVLASASNAERLVAEGALDDEVTLAVRANDTTDIWLPRGGDYRSSPSRPFRSADLAAVAPFCDLVLYSITLNNDLERDLDTLEAYHRFRIEAAELGVRHFLEVFNPNAPVGLTSADIPAFVNDSIVRLLTGITAAQRPVFLKVAYNGAAALEELVEHDPSLVVGVLGGNAGTTRDTFELLQRIESHGGRVALFGRKIQGAESQLDLVLSMRRVLRAELQPEAAVRDYHRTLEASGLTPQRPLDVDLALTDPVLLADEAA